jgi:hypothetical protein
MLPRSLFSWCGVLGLEGVKGGKELCFSGWLGTRRAHISMGGSRFRLFVWALMRVTPWLDVCSFWFLVSYLIPFWSARTFLHFLQSYFTSLYYVPQRAVAGRNDLRPVVSENFYCYGRIDVRWS